MNKRMTMMMAALMMLFMATTALATPPVPASPCTSDDDCGDGEICGLSDCPATDCDPDDPDCKPVDCEEEGWCLPLRTNMPTPSSECDTDVDCPNGFSCDVVGSIGTACACVEGEEDCPCDDEPTKTEDWKECRPKACTTAAECGDGLKCHLYEQDCPPAFVAKPEVDCPEDNPDCNKDIPNDPPKGEDCEPTTKGMCGPTWIGTCEAAADCGPGFDCAPVEICECSSSISTPTSVEPTDTDTDGEGDDDGTGDGASSDPSPTPGGDGSGKADEAGNDDDCNCKPTDESYCQLIKVTCETDGDCTNEGWTCIEAGDSGGVCSFDVETGEEDCEETESEKACVPPGFEAWAGAAGTASSNQTLGNLGGGKGSIDNESANPPTAGPGSDSSSGGCQVGGGVATGLLPLAIFMLLLVFRRRIQHS